MGVENFHIINDSLDAATTIALLLMVTYTTGRLTALAKIVYTHILKMNEESEGKNKLVVISDTHTFPHILVFQIKCLFRYKT